MFDDANKFDETYLLAFLGDIFMRKLLFMLIFSLGLSGCALCEKEMEDNAENLSELVQSGVTGYQQQYEENNVCESDGEFYGDDSAGNYSENKNEGISIIEIADYNGKIYSRELKNGIKMDAYAFVPDISELNVYLYETKMCDDNVRNEILEAVFEQGIDLFDEDIRNPGYFEYKYGERAGDYYLYHTIYPCAGPTICGEMAFMLYNAAPNLYPFEENIVPDSDSFSVLIREFNPFDLAEQTIGNIDCYKGWERQYFVPYGTQGRNPFFRVVYKMKQDNLYVNAYNDTYLLIDQSGIQTFTGIFFDLIKENDIEQVMPLEDAIDTLEEMLPETDVAEYSEVVIDRITIEYIVMQEDDGSVRCYPFWRFYLSYDEYAGRENQNLICGINMINGAFICEERGFWF